ncbi:MAG: hypothetical protein V2A74_08825 [bacterium]
MNGPKNVVSRFVRILSITASVLILTSVTATYAQPPAGGGRFQLDPADAETAWGLQAKGVAQSLSLAPEVEGKLVAAYKGARKSQSDAVAKLSSTGDRTARFQATRDLNVAEKNKLQASLKTILSDAQTSKALETLGSFSGQWDRMVSTIAKMNLEAKNQGTALSAIQGYVVKSEKARAQVAGGDFTAMREATQKLRTELDDELGKVLTKEQLEAWKAATPAGGQGRGGQGQGQGQGQRQGQAQQPAPGAPGAPAAPGAPGRAPAPAASPSPIPGK